MRSYRKMTHRILQDNVELIRGDGSTIRIIFLNMTDPTRFIGKQQGYENYIAYMSEDFGVKIEPCKLVMERVTER